MKKTNKSVPAERRPVVVGVDGSERAHLAALWAGGWAAGEGHELRVIHGYWIPPELPVSRRQWARIADDIQERAQRLLTEVTTELRTAFPDLRVESAAVDRLPGQALAEASAEAQMTVVGAAGHGDLAATMLGSVTTYLHRHARGPVVVIRGNRVDILAGCGSVLVCVDGSMDPEGLLPFAFDRASDASATLLAVHCHNDFVDGYLWQYARKFRERRQTEGLTYLDDRMAACAAAYPEVKVVPVVLTGRPATTILHYADTLPPAERPCLIVAGGHGLSGMAGMILGSTNHALMTHAHCPVAIVPDEEPGRDN